MKIAHRNISTLFALSAFVLSFFFASAASAAGGYSISQQSGSGSRAWQAFDMNRDGSVIVGAANTGYIFISTDGGATWATSTSAGSRSWNGIAVSDDGQRIAATLGFGGRIYISNDGGSTWASSTSAGARSWQGIDMSDDGQIMAAAVYGGAGYIYISTDGGANWVEKTSAGSKYWYDIAVSADGSTIAATAEGEGIFVSTDLGTSWSSNAPDTYWRNLDISDDGSHMVAVDQSSGTGRTFWSADGGDTWATTTNSATRNWQNVGISGDGQVAVAVAYQSPYVYVSYDGAQSWATSSASFGGNVYWYAAAMSKDGNRAVVGPYVGTAYTLDFDFDAPAISDLSIDSSATSSVFSFTTDELATSSIAYAIGNKHGTTTPVANTDEFSITIDDLVPCSMYTYSIIATDQYGNTSDTDIEPFITDCSFATVIHENTLSVVDSTEGEELALMNLSVDIPAGYYSSDLPVEVVRLSEDDAADPEGLVQIGRIYYAQAYSSATSSVGTLDIPPMYTFYYDGEDISLLDESTFMLYYASSTASELSPIVCVDDMIINTVGNYVECEFNGFGYFALYGAVASEPDPEPTPSSHRSGGGRSSRVPAKVAVADAPAPAAPGASAPLAFARSLTVGDSGPDVLALQKFLNANGFMVAASGPGSAGNETSMFGGLTRAALARYQASKGIVPAIGYFGPITRGVVNGN